MVSAHMCRDNLFSNKKEMGRKKGISKFSGASRDIWIKCDYKHNGKSECFKGKTRK
jgi:hypothetical protein